MDYQKAIEELIRERDRIDKVIRVLESLLESGENPTPAKRRGRKSMGEQERLAVSERMKEYWKSRPKRKQPKSTGG